VKEPNGEIQYVGQGKFLIDKREYHFGKLSLVLGGSGITPGCQLILRILRAKDQCEDEDPTALEGFHANKMGISLLRGELDEWANKYPDQFQITLFRYRR
jgi:nitrate reductase (NAD(P)H)